jgi:hypothetical protein
MDTGVAFGPTAQGVEEKDGRDNTIIPYLILNTMIAYAHLCTAGVVGLNTAISIHSTYSCHQTLRCTTAVELAQVRHKHHIILVLVQVPGVGATVQEPGGQVAVTAT